MGDSTSYVELIPGMYSNRVRFVSSRKNSIRSKWNGLGSRTEVSSIENHNRDGLADMHLFFPVLDYNYCPYIESAVGSRWLVSHFNIPIIYIIISFKHSYGFPNERFSNSWSDFKRDFQRYFSVIDFIEPKVTNPWSTIHVTLIIQQHRWLNSAVDNLQTKYNTWKIQIAPQYMYI